MAAGVSRDFVAAAVLAATLAGGPLAAADPPPVAVDRVVADALVAWGTPGASLVVVKGDRTVVLAGYGVKRCGTADRVTPDTLFPLGSCTKAFTAALAGMLADDDVLGWDDPVRRHLPGFRLSDANADGLVAVRDLLTHRTGVRGHDFLWYHAPWNLDEALTRSARLPLEYPFRGGFEYSTIMYHAAGRAVEAAAGKPWDDILRARLTGPLGMTGVYTTTTGIPKGADRATGHVRPAGGPLAVMPTYEMAEVSPAGSIWSSARDLAPWLRFHLSGGLAPGGKRLISEANLKETHTPQNLIRLDGLARRLNPDTHTLAYGLGWVVYDHRGKLVVAHGGMIDGFRTQITLLPGEKLGFALLNNLHDTRMNMAITNNLIDLYCGLPPRDWNSFFRKVAADDEAEKAAAVAARNAARKPDVPPTLTLANYVGTYEQAAYGTTTVAVEKGALVLKWSSFTTPLEHWQGDTFRATSGYFADQLVPFAVAGGGAVAVRFVDQVFERKPPE